MKLLIGVDIGTQGTKAALFDETGACLASAFQQSMLHRPRPGIVEEDPERQLVSVCETIRKCVEQANISPASVAAIGIAGQMAGVIGIDKEGLNVTPYDSWLDTRCTPYIEHMNRIAADEIVAKTGGPASFNHGPKILWWMHERPKVFRSICAFVQPAAYAAMRLCGLKATHAFIDKTYLHFSGFARTVDNAWDEHLCRRFGVAMEKLPRIVDPHRVVGELTASMARQCGLAGSVSVVAGCGDTAASFLACGATRPGICVDVAGTASVFAATTTSFVPDVHNKMMSCAHAATPGLWHVYAYINGGGLNLEWLRTLLAGADKERHLTMEELDSEAAKVSIASAPPMFVPHLGGRVSPSWPMLRGACVGLTWSHGRAHLWRAALEAVALEYALYRDALAELDPTLRISEIRVTGGGQKSALWNRLKANALQLPVAQVKRVEGAPLGSALVAGYGLKLFRDLNQAAENWIGVAKVIRPDNHLAKWYKSRLERYKTLLKLLYEWSEKQD
jgi:xylulokinase